MFKEKNVHILLAVFFIILVLRIVIHQRPDLTGNMMGHLIGIAGTLLMFMALQYPFKKRILGRRGNANPINRHMTYALFGSSLVIIHSAQTAGSLVGLLCFIAMFFVVLSGIVGMFLFRMVNRTVKEQTRDLNALRGFFENHRRDITSCRVYLGLEPGVIELNKADESRGEVRTNQIVEDRCDELVNLARSIAETEYSISVFSKIKAIFSKWTYAHYILALFLFSMIIIHIINAFYYGLR